MRYVITGIVLLITLHAFPQQKKLVDYFYSQKFSDKKYQWTSQGNTGKDIVEYVYSEKKDGLLILTSKKVLPNGMKVIIGDHFKLYEDKIVLTTTQSNLSPALQKLRPTNKTEIQYPETTWLVGKEMYSSFFTSVQTNYKYYDDCFAVEIIDQEDSNNVKIRTYAYGVGLVKEEAFDNDILVYRKELVDRTESQEAIERRKKLSIGFYDLREKDSAFVNKLLPQLEDRIVAMVKKDLEDPYKYSTMETWKPIKANYLARYYREKNGGRSRCDIDVIDSNVKNFTPKFFRYIKVKFPELVERYNGNDYPINLEFFMNFSFDILRGEVMVKNRPKKGIKLLSESELTTEQLKKIEAILQQEKRGTYLITYQFGEINGKSVERILFEKQKSRNVRLLSEIGGKVLLLAATLGALALI